jgi:hypothetical protein
MGAAADTAITINIQHSSPIDIISAQAKASNGTANVSGLVRHPGEPGRDEIFGHVVAEYRTASGGVTRVDVPLTPYEADRSGRDARFSFDIPRIPNAPMTVHLRYVEEPLNPPPP